MPEITFYLNGKRAAAREGMTILEAAKANGVAIPHLCHAGYLEPTGACRVCVVEVEGARALMPSCTVKVAPDMKVKTGTKRVMRARRLVLDLLLSAHPLDCLTCEGAGRCKFQRYCYETGLKETRFKDVQKYEYPIYRDNAFYVRDYNKCILCGRCVRTCAEVQGDGIIDFAHRGFATMVSTPLNCTMEEAGCVFCGNCVASCPTGALVEKDAIGVAREWELKKVTTTCPYCGCGCQFDLNVKDNAVVKVSSSKKAPVNGIALCVKGRFGHGFINNPERLTEPMIRKNGKSRKASWDEAMELVAERLTEIKGKSGADCVGGLASAKCTNEENYVFQKFMRAVIGTNNVDHCARLCHASTVAGLALAFGSGAMTNSIEDIAEAEVILATGTNTTETHPIVALSVKRAVRNGAKLIVVDPRRIPLCDFAAMHLRQKPGTDVAWLNGFMNVIIEEDLWDREFVEGRCEGFEEAAAAAKKYAPERVEKITGIPAEELRAAARLYAGAERAAILYSMGVTQHTSGTDNVLAVANLAMLTGNIGRRGTGVNPLRGQNNVQGACDMGALPNVFTGYQKVTDDSVRRKFARAWNVKRLPPSPGLTVVEMMNAAAAGSLKAMYIMGENPMISDPDINHVREALKNLEFLVVQDIFPSETAAMADVVLPAVSFAEKDGTFTNTERRVQRVRKAIEPVGECRQDWEITADLAGRMGYRMKYADPAAIMREIASLTPSYGGVDYRRIEKENISWPCPDKKHPGTPILHADGFTRGKGKFHAVEHRDPDETTDAEYPLILTTGRMLYHYHTCTMTRRSKPIDEHVPEAYLEVNVSDAARLGIVNGAFCRVASRRGEIRAKAHVSDVPPAGTVFIPFHFAEAAANELTNAALDPVAKIPEYKVCAVRLAPYAEKAETVKY
ncbi:MAG: formate dehydrogenase subunit alpha [bacterium]